MLIPAQFFNFISLLYLTLKLAFWQLKAKFKKLSEAILEFHNAAGDLIIPQDKNKV